MKNDVRREEIKRYITCQKKEPERREKEHESPKERNRRKKEKKREKKAKLGKLRLPPGIKECLNEHGAFVNVDEESIGCPTTNKLNE